MKDYSKTHSFNVDSGDCEAAFCYKNRETGKDTPCSEGDSNGCPATIGQFIEKHNLGFECKRVDSRPDGLMDEGRDQMRHFRCRISIIRTIECDCRNCPRCGTEHMVCNKCGMCGRCSPVTHVPQCKGCGAGMERITKRGMSLYFSQGSGHTADPTLADVLDCLASDASGYDATPAYERGFELWAYEYGYDTDSRKAEKTYKAIKRQAEQMRRTLGDAAYDELLYNTERV